MDFFLFGRRRCGFLLSRVVKSWIFLGFLIPFVRRKDFFCGKRKKFHGLFVFS